MSESSGVTITNSIIANNPRNYAVYFTNSPNTSITYCNFYNNQIRNFHGDSIPPGLGDITNVNINGDSCDIYHNIFLDPLFQAVIGDSAFRLTANSPCIDAGDPNSPYDPDGTIIDIGAYYYHYGFGMVSLTFNPHNPSIVIPSGGGSFVYDATLHNTTNRLLALDIWKTAIRVNGQIYGPQLVSPAFTLPSLFTATREITQYIPAGAPWGYYYYIGNLGIFPDSVVAADTIDFFKYPGDAPPAHNLGWACHGWFDDEEISIPNSQFSVLSSFPNPFNAQTALSYKLQAASNVKLVVYDVSGREAAVLVDGFKPAGRHSMLFNATNLPSGVYFARLTAGDMERVQKLLLVK